MKERVGEWAALQPPAPTGGFADCEAKFLFQGFRPSPPPPPASGLVETDGVSRASVTGNGNKLRRG